MLPQRLDPTYSTARRRFLDAAHAAGAHVDSFPHPKKGLEGEDLFLDVAQVGDLSARSALMITSGTDGAAGYVGSALQSWWLEDRSGNLGVDAPRVLLLHALNPFAFSWMRRFNEDNVDINRNFIDWSAPPANPGYAEIADLLVPTEWTDEIKADTTGALLAFAGNVGLDKTQQIISSGQYDHPTGLFFGGTEPVWSNRWLVEHLPKLVEPADKLGVIDIQGGLPASGTGRIEVRRPLDDPSHQRAAVWWDDVSAARRSTEPVEVSGEWLSAIDALLPQVEVTTAALDYSVVDAVSILQALRADVWLHSHGDPTGPEAAAIRQQMREAFTDDDPEWLGEIVAYFDEVSNAAITALSS